MLRATLLRHGHANDASHDGDRALTEKGRTVVRAVSGRLAERETQFDLIVTSPLVRAVQTAELLAAAVGYPREVLASRVLVPEGHPESVLRFMAEHTDTGNVALVGHEPLLSTLVGFICRTGFRGLRKAEAVRLRLPEGWMQPGELRWCLDPTSLERVKA